MIESEFMLGVKILTAASWTLLKDMRLAALSESPQAFLSTHQREVSWGEGQWRAEFDRGEWSVGFLAGGAVSLLGATRTPSTPRYECYLEYMWVTPARRGSGLAYDMLAITFDRLRAEGVRTAFLYVLDGNDAAMRLYKRAGFTSADEPVPLPDYPGRSEELLQRSLHPAAG
ncbi:MAG TPA: GNAT family N-acetyltransferase [Streptosporangiaceae bacterium]